MGWRYRKSVNVGPLRLNLSRRGIGQSIGMRGIRVGRSASGERYMIFTVPGTGWSYRRSLGRGGQRRQSAPNQVLPPPPSPSSPVRPVTGAQPSSHPPDALPDWMHDHP